MNALIAEVRSHGADVIMDHGNGTLRVQGKIPADLIDRLRSQRLLIINELTAPVVSAFPGAKVTTRAPLPAPCVECGNLDATVYVQFGDEKWCRQCYVGWADAGPSPSRCNWCRLIVDRNTAHYVKTRDAYYCEEKQCHKIEAKNNRQSRATGTGNSAKRSRTSSDNGPTIVTTSQTQSIETPTNSPVSLKTAPFDAEAADQALRITGVSLADDPRPMSAGGNKWCVYVVGRMDRRPRGTRTVIRGTGGWTVDKAPEAENASGLPTFDPLGGK
jgi:hypothetical protein